MRYITEHTSASWSGFLVRVPGTPTKLFSIRKLGLKQARAVAVALRDSILARRPGVSLTRHVKSRDRRNSSGTVGVCRAVIWKGYRYKRRRYRYRRAVWVAQAALVKGRTRNKVFSVSRWGELGAKRRAIAWRKAAVSEIIGKS